MANNQVNFKKINKKVTKLSYSIATLSLLAALGGVAYSIYALIALKKTAFSYATIVLSIIVSIAGTMEFYYSNLVQFDPNNPPMARQPDSQA